MILFGSAFHIARCVFHRYYYQKLRAQHASFLSSISCVIMNDEILATYQSDVPKNTGIINSSKQTINKKIRDLYTESIFNDRKLWYFSNEAAEKLISFVGAALTIHHGHNIMKSLNITTKSIKTFDGNNNFYPSIKQSIINMISSNIAYVSIDSLILLFSAAGQNKRFWSYTFPFLFHHFCVIFGGLTILKDSINLLGSKLWVFTYCYSDLATIWLWISWFPSNYLKICKVIKQMLALENEDGNKEELGKQFDEFHSIPTVNRLHNFTSYTFGGLFLKNRIITFSLTLPCWMLSCYRSSKPTQIQKRICIVCVSGILATEYFFCSRVMKDAIELLTTDKQLVDI